MREESGSSVSPSLSRNIVRLPYFPPSLPDVVFGKPCPLFSFSLLIPSTPSSSTRSIRQPIQQMYTQNHHQQSNGDDDQQREPKPPQHHRRRAYPRPHTAVPEILRDLRRCHGGRVLPEDGHEHEDGGDEDECERGLGYGAGGEGFDVDFAAAARALFVPAREGREEEEGYEGEDYGDDAVMK